MNREQWLTEVAAKLKPLFVAKGVKVRTPFRLTCGWPSRFALSIKARRVGECHPISVSKDGVSEVFISPTIDNSLEVAGVVAHELIHVAVGNDDGHGPKFRRAMKYIGLVGRPTSAHPGKELNEKILKLIEPLDEYPHKAIVVPTRAVKIPSPSVKLECACSCVVRISADDLEDHGYPTCGCGRKFSL